MIADIVSSTMGDIAQPQPTTKRQATRLSLLASTGEDAATQQRYAAAERSLREHGWLHYSRMKGVSQHGAPIFARGEGCYLWDTQGHRYLDGLSGLFTVQVGYGRKEMAEAAARQMEILPFASHFSYANVTSMELVERLIGLATPTMPSMQRVFLTSGGSESVETAIKMARQYQRMRGFPGRYKVLSRRLAYHGATMGALSVNGITALRNPFEPLVPGTRHVANTNCYRCAYCDGSGCCGRPLRDLQEAIEFEGPDTVAAVIIEPVQNTGGCFTPPPGYLEGVRQLCDRYGILFISDEVICAFGRLGEWFGSARFGVTPDLITMAKGMSSGYQPIGGVMVSGTVANTFMQREQDSFMHGLTFGGHPVAAAVALKNLEIMENERVLDNVKLLSPYFRDLLDDLATRHPIIGDVRGDRYFMALELVKDRDSKATFTDTESEDLLRGFLTGRLLEMGLICRADDRGDPVIQLSPPLVAGKAELSEMVTILDVVLTEAEQRVR